MLVDLLGLTVLMQQAAQHTLASHPENLADGQRRREGNGWRKTEKDRACKRGKKHEEVEGIRTGSYLGGHACFVGTTTLAETGVAALKECV